MTRGPSDGHAERGGGDPEEWWREGRRPSWSDFVAAWASLTILPLAGAHRSIGRSALFYPIVGLILGGLWVEVDRAGASLSPWLRAAVTLTAWIVVSGARQIVGFARCAAALAGGRQRALVLMRTGTINADGLAVGLAVGLLATATILSLQLRSLAVLDRSRVPALLFAPLLGCWSRVVLAHGSRAARADGRQMKYAVEVGFREFALASVFTFGVLFSLAQAAGIVVGVCAAVLVVGLRVWLHWWLGGMTDAALAAGAETTATLVLVLFAAFEPR